MGRIDLPYVQRFRLKGHLYHYYRRHGKQVRIHGEPGSPEFFANYERIHASFDAPAPEGTKPGTFGALVEEYLGSPDFKQLAKKSQSDYRRYIERMKKKWGTLPAARMEAKHVLRYRDKMADQPRTANYAMAVLGKLCKFGVHRGYMAFNPAAALGRLKTGPGYKAWPAPAIKRFRESAPPEMVWAMELGLYTGQREGDLVKMRWDQFSEGMIEVAQEKTAARVWVPAHRDLKAVLDGVPKRAVTILTTPHGRVWGVDHFRHQFRDAIVSAGLDGLVFHGLRKTAAAHLAEAGCSTQEIMSITGHKTLAMVEHYTREANQKQRAKAAIRKLERRRNAKVSNSTDGSVKPPKENKSERQ